MIRTPLSLARWRVCILYTRCARKFSTVIKIIVIAIFAHKSQVWGSNPRQATATFALRNIATTCMWRNMRRRHSTSATGYTYDKHQASCIFLCLCLQFHQNSLIRHIFFGTWNVRFYHLKGSPKFLIFKKLVV